MTKDEALKLALEALTHLHPTALTSFYTIGDRDKAITAIKQALAAPVREPVANHYVDGGHLVYPTAQRTWVGLTNNELQPIADEYRILFGGWVEDFARAIEDKLKEKNA